MQELHSNNDIELDKWRLRWASPTNNKSAQLTLDSSKSAREANRGDCVMIAFNSLFSSMCKIRKKEYWEGHEGRVLMVPFEFMGTTYTIVNIYGISGSSHKDHYDGIRGGTKARNMHLHINT